MRNALLILVLVILLSPLLPGCRGGNAMRMMDRADSLIVGEPTAALAILDDIPASSRSGGETEARYNMLRTEALYRALDNPELSDSAIAVSVDYYERHGDFKNAARARYNSAIVEIVHNRYTNAAVSLLMAEFYSLKDTASHFRNGLIQRTLGDCYMEIGDRSSASRYYLNSYDEFLKADEIRYAAHSAYMVAGSLIALDSMEQVERFVKETQRLADIVGDTLLYGYAEGLRGQKLYEEKRYQDAVDLFVRMRDGGVYFSDREINFLGNSYLELGRTADARECLVRLDSLSGGEIYRFSLARNLAARDGDYRKAYSLLDERVDILNDETSALSRINFSGVVGDYYNSERLRFTEELGRAHNRYISVLVIIVLCVIIILLVIRRRHERTKRIMNDKMLEVSSLNKELERDLLNSRDDVIRKENSIREYGMLIDRVNEQMNSTRSAYEAECDRSLMLNVKVRKLLAEKYGILDTLCDEYGRTTAKTDDKTRIYRKVVKIIDSLKTDESTLRELESTIDTYLDGLTGDLKSDFPKLSERDYKIYLFYAVGLSPLSIATILNLTKNTVYISKNRMKAKLGDATSRSGIRYSDILS